MKRREIKFRAWDETTSNPIMVSWADLEDSPCRYVFIESEDVTIMQYTGLKGKDGKEIYEGDILKRGDTIFKVYFDEHCAGFYVEDYTSIIGKKFALESYIAKELYLIGNIHENKNLLQPPFTA